MLYSLFHDYRPIALVPAAILTFLSISLPFVIILTTKLDIKHSANGRGPRNAKFLKILLYLAIAGAVISWFSLVAGKTAIQPDRSSGMRNPNPVLEMIIGPSEIDQKRAGAFGAFMGMVCFLGMVIAHSQVRRGGGLREWIDTRRGIKRRTELALGSAHFCYPDEYKRFRVKDRDGLTLYGDFRGAEIKARKGRARRFSVLGSTFSLSSEDTARGVITIGNPGAGKSQGVILPVIADAMKNGGSLIVADPQGELKAHVIQFAQITGHIVVIHDPTDSTTARFNLTDGIRSVTDARALADVLIPATTGDFWEKASQALIAACLVRYANIGEIAEKLGRIEDMARDLDSQDDDARILASDFIDAARNAPRQAAGAVATAKRALDAWADRTIRESTTVSDFSARMLLQRPVVMVLTCPGKKRRAIAPYLGAVLTRLLLDLDTIGERLPNGALPKAIKFVIDEFPTMGDLRVIVEQANLVRKRRISFLLAAQTIGQLQDIYGKDRATTLLAGMATNIIFGGADKRTAEYYASMSGNTTRVIDPKTERPMERPLLSENEIVQPPHAPQGNAIIFSRYVTADYAVHAVILARLTRMYERADWKQAIAPATSKRPKIYTRAVAMRKYRSVGETIAPPPAVQPVAASSQWPAESPSPIAPQQVADPLPPEPPVLAAVSSSRSISVVMPFVTTPPKQSHRHNRFSPGR